MSSSLKISFEELSFQIFGTVSQYLEWIMDPARISFERQVVQLEQKAQDHTIEENLLIFLATFGVEQPGHHGELDSGVASAPGLLQSGHM